MDSPTDAALSVRARLAMACSAQPTNASSLSYAPPTQAYREVLQAAAAATPPAVSSAAEIPLLNYAGWFSADMVDCPPVLIAHSLAAVLGLLHKTLPAESLSEAAWHQLLTAAHVPGAPTQCPPQSAQKRRPSLTADDVERTPKRMCCTGLDLLVHAGEITRRSQQEDGENEQEPEENDDEDEEQAPAEEEQEEQDAEVEETASTTPPRYTTHTSSHNRRAEARRRRQLEAAAEKRRMAIGLIAPRPDAKPAEQIAHGSILPKDEPTIAWIIKQPAPRQDFFCTAKQPYATATTMLEHAHSIGNGIARAHAASFVHNWRQTGNPLLLAGMTATQAPSAPSSSQAALSLRTIWHAVTYSESMMAVAAVIYRWGMACIGQRYQRELDALCAVDAARGTTGSRRYGEGRVRTQAKNIMWAEGGLGGTRAAFNARLKRSYRWYQATQELGWGFLLLIPGTTITPYWVEQTLKVSEWSTWLQLVERVNKDAVKASRDFDAWLGPIALGGGPIPTSETLSIEASVQPRLQDVQDSEAESGTDQYANSGSDVDESDDDGELSPRPMAPVLRLPQGSRQLTLAELFTPLRGT